MAPPELKQARTSHGPENRLHWVPDEAQWPRWYEERTPRSIGMGVTSFGVMGILIPLTQFIATLKDEGLSAETLIYVPFMLAGTLLIRRGLAYLRTFRRVTLDREIVSVTDQHSKKTVEWKEPLRRYSGVLKRHHLHTGHFSQSEYEVLLLHTDPDKNVALFRSRSWRGQNNSWRLYSSQLKLLPLFEQDGQIVTAAQKPLSKIEPPSPHSDELVWIPYDQLNVSRRVSIQPMGDTGYQISYPRILLALPSIVATFLCIGLWLGITNWLMDSVALSVLFGTLSCIGLVRVLVRLLGYQELFISKDGIEVWSRVGRLTFSYAQFGASQLDNIVVKRGAFGRSHIEFQCGKERICYGQPFPLPHNEELAQFFILIHSHTAEAQGKAA